MFNSTHTFVGFTIARAGFDDWVPYATVTAVIAANLPDVEILSGLSSTASYLDNHRGITHSLIGVPVLALIFAAAMYYFSGNFWKTYVVALAAMFTHPALDYTNTYGLRPFLPFDGTWYYGDLLYIFDPYIDSILLLGLVAGGVFDRNRRVIAWLTLILAVAYIGVRVECRSLAVSQMEGYAARFPSAEQWAVLPTMLNPFAWDGIVGTDKDWIKVRVDSIEGVQGELARVARGTQSGMVQKASQTESGAALLRFARFPGTLVQGTEFGYRVLLFDFRFYDETGKTALGTDILMDRSENVTQQDLSFAQAVR